MPPVVLVTVTAEAVSASPILPTISARAASTLVESRLPAESTTATSAAVPLLATAARESSSVSTRPVTVSSPDAIDLSI